MLLLLWAYGSQVIIATFPGLVKALFGKKKLGGHPQTPAQGVSPLRTLINWYMYCILGPGDPIVYSQEVVWKLLFQM